MAVKATDFADLARIAKIVGDYWRRRWHEGSVEWNCGWEPDLSTLTAFSNWIVAWFHINLQDLLNLYPNSYCSFHALPPCNSSLLYYCCFQLKMGVSLPAWKLRRRSYVSHKENGGRYHSYWIPSIPRAVRIFLGFAYKPSSLNVSVLGAEAVHSIFAKFGISAPS